jgi:hypothetical protein
LQNLCMFFRVRFPSATPNKKELLMKKTMRNACILMVTAGLFTAPAGFAQDAPQASPEELMKKAEEAGKPGPEHKVLEDFAGSWNAEIKMWMEPGKDPVTSKGTAEVRWIMNERFIQEDFTGDFMGKPFKGLSLTGYDNLKKQYVSMWIDDMHTSLYTSLGDLSDDGKVITFAGKADCAITGEKDVEMKQVVRLIDKDKHVFEMHDTRRGENSKVMEITYTRK